VGGEVRVQGEERKGVVGGRNDPNIVCTYEFKKKRKIVSERSSPQLNLKIPEM
jgi:hypothetical protein